MKTLISFLFLFLSISTYSSENSLYNFRWLDDDEQVFVIQNKEFQKSKSLGLDLGLSQSDNSTYHSSTVFSAVVTYYLSELYSIDITRKQYNNSESSDLTNLQTKYGTQVKPIIRVVNSSTIIHFNWIPFYGKVNLFNNIYFFDWGVGLGYGMFNTEGNYKTFANKNIPLTLEAETDSGFNIKSYIKLFTRSKFTFGLDYNLTLLQSIKNAEGTKENILFTDIGLNVGYIF